MIIVYLIPGIATPFFVLKLDKFADIKISDELKIWPFSIVCLRITVELQWLNTFGTIKISSRQG